MSSLDDQRRVRGRATRASVLRAAAGLFTSDGYSATSISAIAAAADVRSASIYHAFGSKERLLAAVVEESAGDFFATLRTPGTDPDGFPGELADVAEVFSTRPDFLRLLIMLAVERRDGDPEILRTALQVRARARAWIADALRPHLADLPTGAVGEVSERMSRLLLMMLDGAFIARQLETSELDVRPLFDLIALAADATLRELVVWSSSPTPRSKHVPELSVTPGVTEAVA